MRYELKIQLPENYYEHAIKRLFSSKYMTSEIYGERQINNIYFDTLGYTDYLSNFHGDSERKKYRIRWYGELNGFINSPTLELKYKKGMTGGKDSISLPGFSFDSAFSYRDYATMLRKQLTNISVQYDCMIGELLQRNPVMVNYYSRRYFLTGDKKYRITLDNNMWFYSFQSALRGHSNIFGTRDPHIVLEVKFESADSDRATRLVNDLGYRLYKNSKYVNGINVVLYNASLQTI